MGSMKLTAGRNRRARTWLLCGLLVSACFAAIAWQYDREVRQVQLNQNLLDAISSQRAAEVQSLLRAGADPNTRVLSNTPPPPPWQALAATLRRLWRHQRPAPRPVYPTALLVAIGTEAQTNRSQEKIIQSLLDAGANPDTIGPMPSYWPPNTPLMWALQSKQTRVVRLLLNNHANPRILSEDGHTCLFYAVQFDGGDALALTSLLLMHGADVNAGNRGGETPLIAATQTATDPALIKLLLDHGADVSARGPEGRTSLSEILLNHQWFNDSDTFPAAKLLIDTGVDVNDTDKSGKSVLQMSVGTKVFPLLLSRGAKLFTQEDPHGAGLLFQAYSGFDPSQKNYRSIETLLDHGISINAVDKAGTPALVLVSECSDPPKATLLLLAHGANVNARDRDGRTALMWAVTKGQLDTARVLLAHGADKAARDSKGRTAMDRVRTSHFDANSLYSNPHLGRDFVRLLSK